MTNDTTASPTAHPSEPSKPTSDECLLGGVAHLALLGGFWLVGPLLVYFWKGKESRFLAFHSVQAILLSLVMFASGILAVVAVFFGFAGVFIGGMAESRALAGTVVAAGYLVAFALFIAPVVISIVAGIRAFNGKMWSIPVIGPLTHRIIDRQAEPQVFPTQ